jgi:Caspase domain
MMRRLAAFFCVVTLMCLGSAPSHAEKRVALVIGNSTYARVPALPNPANDAAAFGAMLKSFGFDVVETKTNLDLASMRRALRDFTSAVRDADIVVVFYAGHGIEVNGTNYLIPVDAALERDIDVEDETVSLDRVNQLIEPAKRLRVVIMDACRDDPFASGMKRTVASRSIGRGLAKVDVTTADTLVAFAARAGSTAADGDGANSPYTSALLRHIATPGLDVRLALGRVRDQVMASTGGRQEPFVYGSLGGAEISLVSGGKATAAAPADPAAQVWQDTKDTKSPALLEQFINRFGDSFYASLARARLEELKNGQTASAQAYPSTTPTKPAPSSSEVALRSAPAPTATSEPAIHFRDALSSVPFPMNGHSLAELIQGTPLFPPIEGLEESVWKKQCASCHQWSQTNLCDQAKTYLKNPKAALRVSHPYGGPEKVAMMQWAKTGCQ